MDPSVIFAIAAGAIIIIGRIINRIAERSGNEIDDTTQSFDAQHQFDGEEAIPARPNDDEDTLAGTILAQIIAERERRLEQSRQLTMQTKQIQTPQFVTQTSTAHKPTKAAKKAKPKANPQTKRAENATPIRSSEANINEMINDFDLRKAVIYSEILKPKFDE